jgi:hypothetical protein
VVVSKDQPPDLQGSPSALESLLRAEKAQQPETVPGQCSDSEPLADDGAGLLYHCSELNDWLRE